MQAVTPSLNSFRFNAGYGYNSNYGAPSQGLPVNSPVDAFASPLYSDSFTLSSDMMSGNSLHDPQDVCHCQFGNAAAQDAFIVPVGDQDNPFSQFNATSMSVPDVNGQLTNPQEIVLNMLLALGFTMEMIAGLAEQRVDLVSLVAQANGMNNLSSMQPNQELVLPTTLAANSDAPVANSNSSVPSTPSTSPSPPTPPTPPAPSTIGSDRHLHNLASAGERRRDEAHAAGNTVSVRGQYVNPHDVGMHNRAPRTSSNNRPPNRPISRSTPSVR
jgi:hypothetical protein